MTDTFTPDQRAKIEAFARSLIEGEAVPVADRAQAVKRQRVESAVTSTVHRLTAQQRTAVIEYLSGKTKTEAATIAGYKHAASQSTRIFQHPAMLAVIDEFFHEQEMSAREVIARLSEQAAAAYAPYLRPSGLVDLDALLGDGKGHLIKGFKHTQYGLNVEFYDAHVALVDIGRVHGIFTDKTDITSGGEKIEAPAYIMENRGNGDD